MSQTHTIDSLEDLQTWIDYLNSEGFTMNTTKPSDVELEEIYVDFGGEGGE